MFSIFLKQWKELATLEKGLFILSTLLTVFMIVLAVFAAGCAFTGVGFILNPAARIEGIPLWMNSAKVFFAIAVGLAVLLCAAAWGSLECTLRMQNKSHFTSPLNKG